MTKTPVSPLDQRRSGVLLHPTSLPGDKDQGTLGEHAFRFVDFLEASGLCVWQMLPLNPPDTFGSPYQCLSAHAGNPKLIDFQRLEKKGWLAEVGTADCDHDRLCLALEGFMAWATAEQRVAYQTFIHKHKLWLEDYALFLAIKAMENQQPWWEWPVELRDRDPEALEAIKLQWHQKIELYRFEQFIFFEQWAELKRYANGKGIYMFGDMPIFVAQDSADVWVGRKYFDLKPNGEPISIAGVPPDYFSATGQRWGNPLYRWTEMEKNDFAWWKRRISTQMDLFDLIRIDHFRGFEAFWRIPAEEETAINGHWIHAPGKELFESLFEHFGYLPFVAEDLGIITDEVEALRDEFELPGMKILQFSFDGGPGNPYLIHQHKHNCVVYTGTHDNDTTVGWYNACDDGMQAHIRDYLGHPIEEMPWPLIRQAMMSPAKLAIIPMQDLLALDSNHRMNTPGVSEGNWTWRFQWDWVPHELATRVHHLVGLYGRC